MLYLSLMDMDMGKRLRQLRELRGLTQLELATRVGRPQSFISHLELGGRLLAEDVPALARALGVPVLAFYEALEEEPLLADALPIDWALQDATARLHPRVRQQLLAFLRVLEGPGEGDMPSEPS